MKILFDARTAADALSMGRTRLFGEIKAGRIKPFTRHPKVLFHRDELERYAAALRDGSVQIQTSSASVDPQMILQEGSTDF